MAYAGTMVFTGIYQQLPEVTGVWTKTSDVFVTNGGNVTTSPNHKNIQRIFDRNSRISIEYNIVN